MKKVESVESVRQSMAMAARCRGDVVRWLARYGGLGPVSEDSQKYSQNVAGFCAFFNTLSNVSPRWVLRQRRELLDVLHDNFDDAFIRERLALDVTGCAIQPELSVRVMAVVVLDELGGKEAGRKYRKTW